MSDYIRKIDTSDAVRADDLSSIAADARNVARYKLNSLLDAVAARSLKEIERKRAASEPLERGDWGFHATADEKRELRDLWIETQVGEDFLRRANASNEETQEAYGRKTSLMNVSLKASSRKRVVVLIETVLKIAFFTLMIATAIKVLAR